MPTLAWTYRILGCDGVFDETLVVTARTTAVYPCVGIYCCLVALMAKKLSDAFKSSGLRIQQNFGAEVSKLVWRQHDASAPF